MNKGFGRGTIPIFSILLCMTVFSLGCGRKALPVPPHHELPPKVDGLSSSIEGDILRLSWTLPKTNGRIVSDFSGFTVYRSKEIISGPGCKECPLLFKRIADIPVDTAAQRGKSIITYNETLEKGYRYAYKVSGYINTGAYGKDSDYIEFDHR